MIITRSGQAICRYIALLWAVSCVAALPMAWAQPAAGLTPGMSFVAQDAAGSWSLYRVDDRRTVVRMPTQLEPRQACVVPDGSKLVYAAADGT